MDDQIRHPSKVIVAASSLPLFSSLGIAASAAVVSSCGNSTIQHAASSGLPSSAANACPSEMPALDAAPAEEVPCQDDPSAVPAGLGWFCVPASKAHRVVRCERRVDQCTQLLKSFEDGCESHELASCFRFAAMKLCFSSRSVCCRELRHIKFDAAKDAHPDLSGSGCATSE